MKYWRKRLTNKAAPNDIMLGQISHELGEHLGMSYFMSIQCKFWTIFISSQLTASLNRIDLLLYIRAQYSYNFVYILQDNQVPVCPLCNNPVPVKKGEMPDVVVGQHIDRDCQSDPALNRRKVWLNTFPPYDLTRFE